MSPEGDKPSKITPPSSFVVGPPTPPATDEKPSAKVTKLIAALKLRQAGGAFFSHPWTAIALSSSDFVELQHQIDIDQSLWGYVSDKVRYDYFSAKQKLVFRMPTILHENFLRVVDHGISSQLEALAASSSSAAELARSISPTGSLRMKFEEAAATRAGTSTLLDQHEPDISFTCDGAKWPGVIIELSYGQKRKDLPRLADDYIIGSDGNVKVVVGIDIEYRGARTATISAWRPKLMVDEDGQEELMTAQTEVDKKFRREDGKPELSTQLCLPLEDFAPKAAVKRFILQGETISFSAETLCQYLNLAEARAQSQNNGIADSLPTAVQKRKHVHIPPEELTTEDEARFCRNLLYKETSSSSEEGS